ncbi:MAG: Glu/Leu/Phe/Val dehydrogenase [Candidatus Micrarchaeota archaeon]|nr:Glu/Leu/Phe/Val dehydrogenase [Candidatus Micrarchaeota archaeon]
MDLGEIEFDNLGPEKILFVYDRKTGMKGCVVIDNTLLGIGKGGIRMTPSVTVGEVCRLARAMTLKNSLAGLPFGGAKAGIMASQDVIKDSSKKKEYIVAFAKAIKAICPKIYVAGPDINTGEEEMRWFVEANGSWKSATGKPKDMCTGKDKTKCGIPHEYGSTGFGVCQAALVAINFKKMDVKSISFAIEGFGNVGYFAAKYLTENGARMVAVSDSKGTLYNSDGIDFYKLEKVKKETGSVINYRPGRVLKTSDLFELDADVLITAAVPDVINKDNVEKIKARIVVEGSNIPTRPEYEEILHNKGILVVPDFVANAGGVISSYAEYKGKKPEDMFKLVQKKITKNTKEVLELSKKEGIKPRDAAMKIAISRIKRKLTSSNAGGGI